MLVLHNRLSFYFYFLLAVAKKKPRWTSIYNPNACGGLSSSFVYWVLLKAASENFRFRFCFLAIATSSTVSFQTKYMVDPDVQIPTNFPDVQIPTNFDPFAESNDDSGAPGAKEYVHIRIQQRNGRKSLTTVQGLKKEFSYQKILKDLKKEFCCNGTVVQDKELGKVIQLQGDQRKNVASFLVQAGIVKKDRIKVHGF